MDKFEITMKDAILDNQAVKMGKKTAPIPENYDCVEKGCDGLKWRLCAGGNDWEPAWSTMVFEIGEPVMKRIWATICYPELENFSNGADADSEHESEQASKMGKELVRRWLSETNRIYNDKSKETYEFSWEEACWSALNEKGIKEMVDKKGIDVREWKPKKMADHHQIHAALSGRLGLGLLVGRRTLDDLHDHDVTDPPGPVIAEHVVEFGVL